MSAYKALFGYEPRTAVDNVLTARGLVSHNLVRLEPLSSVREMVAANEKKVFDYVESQIGKNSHFRFVEGDYCLVVLGSGRQNICKIPSTD